MTNSTPALHKVMHQTGPLVESLLKRFFRQSLAFTIPDPVLPQHDKARPSCLSGIERSVWAHDYAQDTCQRRSAHDGACKSEKNNGCADLPFHASLPGPAFLQTSVVIEILPSPSRDFSSLGNLSGLSIRFLSHDT